MTLLFKKACFRRTGARNAKTQKAVNLRDKGRNFSQRHRESSRAHFGDAREQKTRIRLAFHTENCRRCGYSTRSVQRALNKLEQRGLVIIHRRRGRSNCYKIDWKVFYRRDEQSRAAMAILTDQGAGDLNLDWTDCRNGTSSRSATLDSLTPKESRVPIKDLAGFDELNALEDHQRKYGVDAEMAFMGQLDRRGHHSLIQALAPDGIPNFRIEYDPSEQSADDKHEFHLIWHHASVGKFKDLARVLAPLGFKPSNLYSAASYANMKARSLAQHFAPVPISVLLEELASR